MNIDAIRNGIVIDHIRAGKAMEIYTLLNLEALDCSVAIIKNAPSELMGKKDIIKIDRVLDVRRAASLKAGGIGLRYTIRIHGKATHLYFEDPQWFVEGKA